MKISMTMNSMTHFTLWTLWYGKRHLIDSEQFLKYAKKQILKKKTRSSSDFYSKSSQKFEPLWPPWTCVFNMVWYFLCIYNENRKIDLKIYIYIHTCMLLPGLIFFFNFKVSKFLFNFQFLKKLICLLC